MVGSQDYLTKPFSKEQLLRAVQQFGRQPLPPSGDEPDTSP